MTWENLTEIATRTHLKTFGSEIILFFSDGRELSTKGIFSPQITKLKENNSDFESYALKLSIAQKDVNDLQSVVEIYVKEKRYQILKYEMEADGFVVFFLSE